MSEFKTKTSKAILLYLLVALFLVFEMGVQVSPSVMSSQLMHDLGLGTFGLGIMSGFYFYSYALMQAPSGMLHDKFSPRLIITISILVCVVGTFLFGISNNIYMGILARLLMGCGSAFAFVSVLVITADLFQAKYFALMTGITQLLAAFGAMSGQIPLSKLIAWIGWRETMFTLAAIGLVLAVLTFMFVRYKRNPNLHHSQDASTKVLSKLKTIIANKQSWYVAFYAFLLWAPMSGFASLWGVPYLEKVYGLSSTMAATTCSFMWLGLALFSPILGWLSTLLRRRTMPLALSAFFGGGAFALIIFVTQLPHWLLGVALFVAGAGCAGQALSFSVVKENNSRAMSATAIGFNNMAMVISGALFQPLIGKILQVHWFGCSTFKLSMVVILFSYMAGALIAFLKIRETRCQDYQTGVKI